MPGANKQQSARRWGGALAVSVTLVLGCTAAILGIARLLRTEYECEEGARGADGSDQYCSCVESKDPKKLSCTREYSCCLALESRLTFMDHDRVYDGPKLCSCDNRPAACEGMYGYPAKRVDHCPETD